ncbi:hypothetical protein P3S67_010506 [Capsicum chacoense]
MLVEAPDNSTQKLVLLDTIQRLGVAYHFANEIEASIENIFDTHHQNNHIDDNLYIVSLRFRLLRRQGHYMSSDIFKKLTDQAGKFRETLTNDVQGLLSLYEAAHLRVCEEEILEEALAFTTTHLESMKSNLNNSSIKVRVTEALRWPIRKTAPRMGARKYISTYENTDKHNDLLLKFAKLDFNALQKLHQRELCELTRFVRKMMTKVLQMASFIDDTFDAYGIFDELVSFTDAIQRWDTNAINSVPPYLRHAYQVLLGIYDEMEQVLAKECKLDSVYYAKYEMKKLVRAYFKEAQWLNADYTPRYEEHMENALATSAYLMASITCLVGIEKFISRETFEWLKNDPLIVRVASLISRAMDDVVGYELVREHMASLIECYVKEYGVSK